MCAWASVPRFQVMLAASAARRRLLIVAHALALVAACARPAELHGPVRTADQARAIAGQALAQAHLDEEITGVERQDGAWIVTTRWRETSAAGHLLTVDAASGKVGFQRYRTLQLGDGP